MATEAQIQANRRNAAKSTGPRTAQGKERVRLNAVTHGITAATAVLPHEDGEAYRRRVEAWSRELDAPGELGAYLAERAVRLSWQLDRADAHELKRLPRRIREAPKILSEVGAGADAGAGAGRAEAADDMIGKLFEALYGPTEPEELSSQGARRGGRAGAVPEDPPAALVRELESSAEGCCRLRAEWDRIRDWLERPGPDE